MNSCHECKHLHRETESWELPDIWWWECAARPGLANLKSFPFHHTRCRAFDSKCNRDQQSTTTKGEVK